MSQNYSNNRHRINNTVGFSFPPLLLTFAIALCLSGFAFPISDIHEFEKLQVQQLAFTENQGQWPDSILYRGTGGGATMWFTKTGVYYQFSRVKQKLDGNPSEMEIHRTTRDFETTLMKAGFVGTNPGVKPIGEHAMDYKCNFFLGDDPTRWRTDVDNYESISYRNIYEGIDLKYYSDGQQLKCDFIVSPGADISQIQLQFESAKSVTVNSSGQLLVESLWGSLPEQSPVIYQEHNGERRMINGIYESNSENFTAINLIGDYDASQTIYINPTPTFSTYLGGSSTDYANDIAVSASGEAFVCGYTLSTDFPRVLPYDDTFNGNKDAFVTRFNAAGNGLLYSTFLGGNGDDVANALDLYNDAVPYLVGETNSSNFPTTPNAIDNSINGGQDCFLAVQPSNSLNFSTFLGGSGSDFAFDIALRCPSPCSTPIVNVFVVGSTASGNFPTVNAYDVTLGGTMDAFMARYSIIHLGSNSLDFCTYLGGSANDYALAVAISGSSTLVPYVAGETFSSNFPTANAYDNSLAGTVDAFITSFGVAGNGSLFLSQSTFFGGSELADPNPGEVASEILVRSSGNICIAGHTSAPGLATAGSFDLIYNGGIDTYVAEFNSSVSSLVYCTYLGGTAVEAPGYGCLSADGFGNLYIGGSTQSADFPLADAYDASLGGTRDAFIAKLSGDGATMSFGTFLGGVSDDHGNGVAVDASGCIYTCGYTESSDFPIVNPYDGSLGGTGDAYLAKICLPVCGDADGSGIVTISDAVYLINYIFAGGPAPNPLLAGDVDCNGIVTISDAVYLINYIFAGGAAPCAACM